MSHAFATIDALARAYRDGSVSPVEVAEECLDRIRRHDGGLHAFITVTDELAISAARRAEQELARGLDRGPMHGIPVALKDLVDTAGVRTTAGSLVLAHHVPDSDAPLWAALQRAGAVLMGKTNMQEFANGVPHPAYGQTRNPWDVRATAGGSSGGSAAAVVAGFCHAAVGSDTGGSIRVPASYCGAVGLKPTYDLVSTQGVFPLSWSLDHAGPMARTSRDAAAMLAAITALAPVVTPGPAGVRLGVITAHASGPELTPEARTSFETACRRLQDAGIELVPVTVPDLELSEGLLPTITGPESAVAHQDWLEERAAGYADQTRRQITFGSSVPAVAYVRAQQYRRHLAARLTAAMRGLDALLSPTVAWSAPTEDPSIMSQEGEHEGRRTVPYNLVGFPALSVPSPRAGRGLPLGLQVASLPHTDMHLLALGDLFESIGAAEVIGPPDALA